MYCTQPPGNPGTKLKAHTTRAPASRHLMRKGGRSSLRKLRVRAANVDHTVRGTLFLSRVKGSGLIKTMPKYEIRMLLTGTLRTWMLLRGVHWLQRCPKTKSPARRIKSCGIVTSQPWFQPTSGYDRWMQDIGKPIHVATPRIII